METTLRRLSIASIAAFISGLLGGPMAIAVLPLKEGPTSCADWVLKSNTLTINLSNGSQAYIPWDQNGGKDTAAFEGGTFPATLTGKGETWHGQPVGEIENGNKVDITVTWIDGDRYMNSHFRGTVVDMGTARGTATDSRGNRADWVGQEFFTCADQPKPAQPEPAPVAPPPALSTITGDVDVYADPGGVGKPIGFLPKNTKVTVLERRDDNWVHFSEALLNKKIVGWIWGDFVSNP